MSARDASRAIELRRLRVLAKKDFVEAAVGVIRLVAEQVSDLTSDDVWFHLGENVTPDERRSMGVALLAAADRGIIESTDRVRPSKRRECRMRPVRVWQSRIWRER